MQVAARLAYRYMQAHNCFVEAQQPVHSLAKRLQWREESLGHARSAHGSRAADSAILAETPLAPTARVLEGE